jgi:hypothetical protein
VIAPATAVVGDATSPVNRAADPVTNIVADVTQPPAPDAAGDVTAPVAPMTGAVGGVTSPLDPVAAPVDDTLGELTAPPIDPAKVPVSNAAPLYPIIAQETDRLGDVTAPVTDLVYGVSLAPAESGPPAPHIAAPTFSPAAIAWLALPPLTAARAARVVGSRTARSVGERTAPPDRPRRTTGLAASTPSSSGGGFSPSLFLALLVALAGLACLLSERLRLPSQVWKPAIVVSFQERPG